jgi:dnd system-associated protein 4
MVSVYLPLENKPLIDSLVEKTEDTGTATFTTMMDLMCFAAMVGYSASNEEDEEIKFEKGSEIKSLIFENEGKDSLAYLLAVHEAGDGEVLREGNEGTCYAALEKYANVGLQVIEQWMSNNPTDIDGIETILNQVKHEAHLLLNEEEEESPIRPEI